jgi:hypothetical protein
MRGEILSTTKAQIAGVTVQRRHIPRSYSLGFGHSNAVNTSEKREKSTMKMYLTIAASLAFATAAVRGQDLPTYISTLDSQSPIYYNQLGTGLAPSIGTGTFVADGTTGFTNDYFGNADDASYFSTSASGLVLAGGTSVINTAADNSIGSISMLIYAPNATQSSSRYFFDDGDTSPNEFEVKDVSGVLNLQVGNKAITPSGAQWNMNSGTWYYFAATWNFSGANTNLYGINYYLGPAGSNTASLASGFLQRGGSGNISSGAGLGGGGTVTVSGNLAQTADGFEDSPGPGFAEALASFSNELSLNLTANTTH